MSITNHAELKTAVANWLKRNDLTSYIDDFIALAEVRINRDVASFIRPLRALESQATGVVNTETLALPTGYAGTKRFSLTIGGSDRVLEYGTPEQVARFDHDGLPVYYTINGSNFHIYPHPVAGYDYKLDYLKNLDSLSLGANWLITNAPDVYLYGTLLQATPYIKNDKRIPVWEGLYQKALNDLEMQNEKEFAGNVSLRMKARGAV